ncbi:MAG TPA: xanthine dehydrogenase family protein subunit M [Solirubrobacteraceae bacterium]|nr:xanthine dehydrogenase family protein subunit M [Solirubrobacteraceae bacterium]
MKPPKFAYVRPASIEEAIGFVGDGDRFAKVIAGGQSLVPMMNFRLARPELLVDLRCVPGLSGARIAGRRIDVGAMTIQRELELADDVHALCPLLRAALVHVGHQPTRNRGTVGGSLVHADPAAELPAVALALDGEMIARGPSGSRTIKAENFYLGPYTSALADDEILVEVRFSMPAGTRTGFIEFARRAGDFALGGVAAALCLDHDVTTIEDARIAAFGVGSTPLRLRAVEDALRGGSLGAPPIEPAARVGAEEISPIASHGVSESYRRRLIAALLRRVLKEMID